MKRIFAIVMLLVMGLSTFVRAEDPPGMTPMDNDIEGNSSIQNQQMPDDVANQAQTAQEKALWQQKFNKCMQANATAADKNTYCTCVANGGVQLNTNVPFVGKCINKDDTQNAFPSLIGGISRMVVTAILIISFMFIIIGGVQWASGKPKEGKEKIIKVIIGLAILGASGAILRLINPNFFQ